MIYRYTIIYVADVAARLAFYQTAFGYSGLFLHDSGDFGELDTGGTKLCFSSHALMAQIGKAMPAVAPGKASYELAFETVDVAQALAEAVKAVAALVSELKQMRWGQTQAYVRAPEGTLIELCTAVAG